MLARMWNNRKSYLFMMGMQNGTSASEDSLAVSYKIKYTLILEPSNCSRWHLSQLVETLCPHKNLLMNAYRSFISNCQNLEITNISFSQSVSQFSHSVMSNSLRPHEPQHARPPCPSPTPGVHPNPCPLSR